MLAIRLQRVGRRNAPAFRIVVVDSHAGPKTGRPIETIGSYNPRGGTPEFSPLRMKYWLSVGAQPSATLHNFLVDKKILEGKKKKNVLSHRFRNKIEEKPKVATEAPKATSSSEEEAPIAS